MKINKQQLSMGILVLLGISCLTYYLIAQTKRNNTTELEKGLQLTLTPEKNEFSLGEMVFLNFKISNNTNQDIFVKGLDLDSGYIKVYIASPGKELKKYQHARVKKTSGRFLKAGEVVESRSGIIWNFIPPYSNPGNFERTDIQTEYAFPKPGTYLVKAVLHIPNSEKPIEIESNTVRVTINEPIGEDLEVWNKIKDKGDFGYFIQEAEIRIPEYSPEERIKFEQEIEQIATQHPDSLVANQIRQSLKKFKDSEQKRKEYIEKTKQQKSQ